MFLRLVFCKNDSGIKPSVGSRMDIYLTCEPMIKWALLKIVSLERQFEKHLIKSQAQDVLRTLQSHPEVWSISGCVKVLLSSL